MSYRDMTTTAAEWAVLEEERTAAMAVLAMQQAAARAAAPSPVSDPERDQEMLEEAQAQAARDAAAWARIEAE